MNTTSVGSTPYDILARHYRKGVLLLEAGSALEHFKVRLLPLLRKIFPHRGRTQDSSFVVFCQATWPGFAMTTDPGLSKTVSATFVS